jgi:hypothetical protein
MSYDLNTKLMQFGTGDNLSKPWRIKHAVLGIQAFGSNGSGKSSSLKTVALKYLRANFGFLILSAKSERETWEHYCELAGRSDDLIIIGEDSPHRFDFLRYLSENDNGTKFTSNLLNILKKVIQAMDGIENGKSDDPFWDRSLSQLLHHTITINQLAYGHVDVQEMFDIIQSAPKGADDDGDLGEDKDNPDNPFIRAYERVRASIAKEYQQWCNSWSAADKSLFQDRQICEKAFLKLCPKARQFKFVEQFFNETFKKLSNKTRGTILLSLTSFLFSLLEDPIYSLFCSGEITCSPEDALNGRIILLDLPTRHYHEAGRAAQLLFKYIAQLQWEKRDIKSNDRVVCLWSDESAEFLMEHDAKFQALARDCNIALVYCCQNVHQLYAAMGGAKSTDKVLSYLGTLNTKLFFSNSDTSSNELAAKIVGDAIFYDPSRTITTAEKFSITDSISLKVDRILRPDAFSRLKTGGTDNGCNVEAYIHVQGDSLFNGRNFKKIRFNQNYQ